MSITFNADEVLAMAERIEENGTTFYRRAAALQPEAPPETIAFLGKLADMEEQHRATFAAMRATLPTDLREQTAFDPYLEAALYLNAMADTHKGEGSLDQTAALTGKESLAEILRIAIGLEEKSILFYLGLREMVPPQLGRQQVDNIIAEEKNHLSTLANELRRLTMQRSFL